MFCVKLRACCSGGLLVQVQCKSFDGQSLPVGGACLACHLEASAELGEQHSAP